MKAFKVTPLVVVWGDARHGVPEGALVRDVECVSGEVLTDGLRLLDGDVIDAASAADGPFAVRAGFPLERWVFGGRAIVTVRSRGFGRIMLRSMLDVRRWSGHPRPLGFTDVEFRGPRSTGRQGSTTPRSPP